MSPTQRTLAWLREQGYHAQVVERFNSHAGVRVDLFGIIDIIAVTPHDTIGVQATSLGVTDRLKKIQTSEGARHWLSAGRHRRLWIVGWRKYKKAENGKHWRPIVREVQFADLEAAVGRK